LSGSAEDFFGVRQLAAAFYNGTKVLFFNRFLESGSKLPHSESFAYKNYSAF
jgi:hypothetical protein